jgi:DNA helicase II / ATP-dependent DNA helicase PcrA
MIDPIPFEFLVRGLDEQPSTIRDLVAWMIRTSEEEGVKLEVAEISPVLLRVLRVGVEQLTGHVGTSTCRSEHVMHKDMAIAGTSSQVMELQEPAAIKQQVDCQIQRAEPGQYQPSHYQKAVFDWMKQGTGNAVIVGVAGCGKTTTIVEALKLIPPTDRVLLLAFNRHIRLALQERVPKHVDVETFNSFGWKIYRENVRGVKMTGTKELPDKDRQLLIQLINPEQEAERYSRLKRPVLALVSLLKAMGECSIDRWSELAVEYGVDMTNVKTEDKFEDVLVDVFRKSMHRVNEATFDDQLYQPIIRAWRLPRYDWVMIDEAQDCSPINIAYVKGLVGNGARAILVGDPDQSIYLFRGAHPDAMGTMADDLAATSLPLSICYRCPDAVLEAARDEVPRIEGPSPNPRGEGICDWIETPDFESQVKAGDLVLCRMTHPLIKRCLIQWGRGKKAFVKGRNLSDEPIALIEKVHSRPTALRDQYRRIQTDIRHYKGMMEMDPSMANLPVPIGPSDIDEFLSDLSEHVKEQTARLEKKGLDELADQLSDRHMGITNLAEGCTHVLQIIIKMEAMFTDSDDENAIWFMTGHRAKGLEKDRVWILRPDLCPSKKAKTPAAQKQERNLMYVMKTRAMQALYFVTKEKDEK